MILKHLRLNNKKFIENKYELVRPQRIVRLVTYHLDQIERNNHPRILIFDIGTCFIVSSRIIRAGMLEF